MIDHGYYGEAEIVLDSVFADTAEKHDFIEATLQKAELFSWTDRKEEAIKLCQEVCLEAESSQRDLESAIQIIIGEGALEEAEQLIERHADALEASQVAFLKGYLALGKGHPEDTLAYLEGHEALANWTDQARIARLRSDALQKMEGSEAAANYLSEIYLQRTNNISLLTSVLALFWELKWNDKILEFVDIYAHQDEVPPKLSPYLIHIYWAKNDWMQVARHSLNVLLSDPWDNYANLTYGLAMARLKVWDVAEFHLSEVVSNPKYRDHALRALCHVFRRTLQFRKLFRASIQYANYLEQEDKNKKESEKKRKV